MERNSIIKTLVESLKAQNTHLIGNGQVTKESLEQFLKEEETRYNEMSDIQLQNILMINCF